MVKLVARYILETDTFKTPNIIVPFTDMFYQECIMYVVRVSTVVIDIMDSYIYHCKNDLFHRSDALLIELYCRANTILKCCE